MLALENKIAAIYFNDCNNMAFHHLSRNKEAPSDHNLSSFLGLGTKCCHQKEYRLKVQNK